MKKRRKNRGKALRIITIIFLSLVIIAGISYFTLRRLYPLNYSEYITKYSEEFSLDPYLVSAVIKTESNFNSNAVSHRDALGLMQLLESTANWGASELGFESIHKEDLFKPDLNIRLGCWYLRKLLTEFGNDEELTIVAYNSGSGNVKKWLADKDLSYDGKLVIIPFKETADFLKRVNSYRKIYSVLYKNL
ncbi:MAG: lytic transglycosylase domain-containing protein [Eubacteriales bacterium]|nr:lytic transglycosylase domain-containing protein [Eubacteriales bacterium]